MANNYPNWQAGDPITASALNYTQGEVIVKPSTTDRPSTTTVTDDPHLTTTLDANATYSVELHLKVAGLAAADIKTNWTVPSGASGTRNVRGAGTGSTTDSNADNATMRTGVHNFSTDVVYNNIRNTVNSAYVTETGVVTTTSAGTLALSWAQNSSNATATSVVAGSIMTVKRIA